MSDRDEEAVPMDEIADVVERVLGQPTGMRMQFHDRKGRGEKIVMVFEEGGTITIAANTRKAGASRRALVAFLERCGEIGREVHEKLQTGKGET